MNHKRTQHDHEGHYEGIVVLKGVQLTDNYADVGGGAVVASNPQHVAVLCSSEATEEPTLNNILHGLTTLQDLNKMPRLSDKVCRSWTGNKVGQGGYGAIKATFAATAVVCIVQGNACRPTNGQLPTHISAKFLPPLKIILIDQFGQMPAEPSPDQQALAVFPASDHVRLSGQLNAGFERGEALLTETTVTGHPGDYSMLLQFHDDRIDDIQLESALRSCSLGEQSVLDNTACQRCEVGMYSVQEPLDNCKECPHGCVCKKWGIAPQRHHWMSSPCMTHAEECLSDTACNYGIL